MKVQCCMQRFGITVAAAALIFFAGYAALFIAPDESTMHADPARVSTFTLPTVDASMYTALTVAFVANIAWLATRQIKWDWLGVSAVGGGSGFVHGRADDGRAVGQARVGHLVDLGCAADDDVHPVAALHLVPAAARAARRPGAARYAFGGFRDFRVSRCAARVRVESAVADAASRAGDFRRRRIRASIRRWARCCCCAFLRCCR